MTTRAHRVRAFARDLETRYDRRFEVSFDSGTTWDLSWGGGPSRTTVRQLAATADLAGAALRTYRSFGATAVALTAIRMAGDGRLDRDRGFGRALYRVEDALEDIDFPETPDDALHEKMGQLLLAAARADRGGAGVDERAADLVHARGIGWLVEAADDDGFALPPLTALSARYARRSKNITYALDWTTRATPMPLHAAMTAALDDPDPSPRAAAALLALIPELRAELARTEAAIADTARRAGLDTPTSGTGGQP